MTAARHPKLAPLAPVAAGSGTACLLAAMWALWPVTARPIPSAEDVLASIQPEASPGAAGSTEPPFDAAAFHTPLWIAVASEPASQAPAPSAPPPIPPLRATLLAIARDTSHAIIHDQDADRIATLRIGDAIQGRIVARIEPSRLTLTLDGRPQTLDLGYQIGVASPPPSRRDASAGREAVP